MPQSGHHPCSLLTLLALAVVAAAGCDATAPAAPLIAVEQVNHWAMPAAGAKIPAPRGLAFDKNGDLFVLDDAGRILVFDTDGKLNRQWFMPEYEVGKPEGICLFNDGRIAVADTHYHRIVFFNRAGEVLSMHGEYGSEPGQFIYLSSLTQDKAGNYYVCEYGGNDRVQKFGVDGNSLAVFGGFGTDDGQFQRPMGVVWRDGLLYVADAINNRIQVFRDDGCFVSILGEEADRPRLHYPYDLVGGPEDDLFAIEYGGNRVTRLNLQGRTLGIYGSTGHAVGRFSTPWGLAVDQSGRIVVADTGNRRLVELQR
jgi:iron(III) transport system ATP-binding protein